MNIDGLSLKHLLPLLLLSVFLVTVGCEGTESRETVEELTGKKNLEHYQEMKDELGDIQAQQTQRLRQLDSAAEDQ